jgi:hypothetical protein
MKKDQHLVKNMKKDQNLMKNMEGLENVLHHRMEGLESVHHHRMEKMAKAAYLRELMIITTTQVSHFLSWGAFSTLIQFCLKHNIHSPIKKLRGYMDT